MPLCRTLRLLRAASALLGSPPSYTCPARTAADSSHVFPVPVDGLVSVEKRATEEARSESTFHQVTRQTQKRRLPPSLRRMWINQPLGRYEFLHGDVESVAAPSPKRRISSRNSVWDSTSLDAIGSEAVPLAMPQVRAGG